ncbi:hypothetical protein lerEdw1_006128 [Lerista edwardsae]|nr:hypothetical protein lerEdw1_006128 [Lerista edwardsae]
MSGCGMEADYPAFENPLCGELKHICKRIKETYKEIKEDLTPYKDDRYYRLAPMRLYTLSKRHFVLVFVVFFICFGLTVLIGLGGPDVIEPNTQVPPLNNGSKISFNLSSPPLSTYNQQLWLTCIVQLDQTADNLKKLSVTFNMGVTIRGVIDNASVRYFNKEVHSRTKTLNCAQQCAEIIVVHLGYLNYTRYDVSVTFDNLPRTLNIKNFIFMVDPFFPLSFLINSWFPGMLDDLFQSLFLCALLLFWLCVYHGIRVQGERKCLMFYFPKFLIVGLLWLASVTLGIWQTVNELHDPTYQYGADTKNFQGMKIFFLVVAAVYILYLLFLIIRACSELRNMPYVESQLKDNPAFSMLNDSDDDVIYGSDYEEMPLQNGQAIRAKFKEESDSD